MSDTPPDGEPQAAPAPASWPNVAWSNVPGPAPAEPAAVARGTWLAGSGDQGGAGPAAAGPEAPPRLALPRPEAAPPQGRPRRNRSAARWRAAFFGLAGLAIVLGVTWALLGNQLLVVRSVTVTGTHRVTAAEVIAAANVPLGTPLLRVDPGAVSRRVETIEQVASATVTEDWPDHLAISVTERVPVMAVKMASGGYDLLDRRGLVRYSKSKPALPVLKTTLTGAAMDHGNPSVAAAAEVLGDLQPWLARQVVRVSVIKQGTGPTAELAVNLALSGGQAVLWGDPSNPGQKNRELKILLATHVRYVDVSAPGTVVTK